MPGLDRAMKRAGYDQTRLAEKLGISRPAVGQWLSGATKPNSARLLELATTLNVDVTELVERDTSTISAADPSEQPTSLVEQRIVVTDAEPQLGDKIYDLDEIALLRLWRALSIVKKAALFAHLGADDMPSLRKIA